MKLNVTLLTAVKIAATVLLLCVAVFSHSLLYTLLPLAAIVGVWWTSLKCHWIIPTLCVAVLLAGMVWTMPHRGFNADRRLNLLVDNGDSIVDPTVSSWLTNAVLPECELTRPSLWPSFTKRNHDDVVSGFAIQRFGQGRPVYVRMPSHPRSGMYYHVVLVPQRAHGCRLEDQQGMEWLDSCIVVTLGTRDTSGNYSGVDLAAFTLRVLPALRRLGYPVDRRYVSLIDDSGDGSLANVAASAPGDVWRNIIRLNCPADTTLPRSQARQVMIGNRPEYATAYAAWRDAGIDTDHFSTNSADERQSIANDVLTGRLGVAMSRIELAHEKALRMGFNGQFVMFTDYSIPSGKYRFFLYDYDRRRIVVRSKCAHGCGPGNTEAVPVFSNEMGSCCTALGDYAVHDVHPMFKNGRIAISLDGLDPTNDNATARGIKMHSGMRMEGEIYPRYLKLGKLSEGCVALGNIPFAMVCGIVDSSQRPILLQCYTHPDNN